VDQASGLHPTCRPVALTVGIEALAISGCGLIEPVGAEAEGGSDVDVTDLDAGEIVDVLAQKAKKAKVERKEARDAVQNAFITGLKKKKKQSKNIKKMEKGKTGSSLPVLGL